MARQSKSKLLLRFNAKNKANVIRGGRKYFDLLLELINNATESIHLQTYIFNEDATGKEVAEALIAAAKRNVEVHLMADGYASKALSEDFINSLKSSGILFRFFEPLLKSKYFYLGRRMHHKIFVVDARFALVGGINVADRYNEVDGIPPWLDFALYVEGEIAKQLCVFCWKTWNGFIKKMGITPCEQAQLYFDIAENEISLVRMRRNDWVRNKNQISATYLEMFRTAKSHIIIVGSYFLPGEMIRRALRNAVKRGVKIRVITSADSDVMVSKYAERWMYDWLIRNKIELYEYQPAVLHGKMAVCDGKWFTIGSYNVNDISAYASVELNLDVRDERLSVNVETDLEKIIQNDCVAITKERNHLSANILKRFAQWLAYKVIRLIFVTVTFYYKQRKD